MPAKKSQARKRSTPKRSTAAKPTWRAIVASALDWHEAHATLDDATDTEDFPLELRGKRPDGFPHSAWELLEHIRLTTADLAAFMGSKRYVAPEWPADYWPATPAPADEAAWKASLAAIHRDIRKLKAIAEHPGLDLTSKIPAGTGQTYLRSLLVAVDHTSYHVGQLVAVRRLVGAWKAE